LVESQGRLRAIFDSQPEGLQIIAPDGSLLDMNRTGLQMIEADDLGQVQSRPMTDLIAPQSRSAFADLHRRVLTGQKGTLSFEVIGVRGTHRWLSLEAVPLRTSRNEITAQLGVLRDITGQVHANGSLADDDGERLASLLAATPTVIYSAALKAGFPVTFVSDSVTALTGYDPDEFLSDPGFLAKHLHPQDAPDVLGLVDKVAERDHWVAEYRFRFKDGGFHWVKDQARVVRDATGRAREIVGSWVDITDQKAADSLVAAEKKVLEMIARATPLPMVLEAIAGSIETLSADVVVSLMLLELDGVHLRHGAAPSLPEEFNRAMDGIAIGPRAGTCGTAAYLRKPVIATDIATDPLWEDSRDLALVQGLKACWSTPIQAGNGQVWGTISLYHRQPHSPGAPEIALVQRWTHLAGIAIERQRAEVTLRANESRYRTLFETSPDGVALFGMNMNLLMISPRGAEIFGYPGAAGMIGRTLREFVAAEDFRVVDLRLGELMKVGSLRNFDFTAVRRDGSRYEVETSASLVRDANGRAESVIAIFRDVTARKQSERELRQLSGRLLRAQEEERRHLANELHDSTAQNLVALSLNVYLLRQLVPLGDPDAEKRFDNCAELITRSIQEVRSISFLLHPPMLDSAGLPGALAEYLDGFRQQSGLEVVFNAPGDFGRVNADVELALFRIVQESLANVYRHSGSATARIKLAREGNEISLSVADSGCGIPPQKLKAFNNGRSGEAGIGLTGMSERMRQLGGLLEVESSSNGTTIRASVFLVNVATNGSRHLGETHNETVS
jgi:PAS domain S-box-containing protein